jgi:hypothetical protein
MAAMERKTCTQDEWNKPVGDKHICEYNIETGLT